MLEVERRTRRFGGIQMADMNGVERTAEQANAPRGGGHS
jgi:hypothetical protein